MSATCQGGGGGLKLAKKIIFYQGGQNFFEIFLRETYFQLGGWGPKKMSARAGSQIGPFWCQLKYC